MTARPLRVVSGDASEPRKGKVTGELRIGKVARQVGVTAKAIRFYEVKRLLPRPTRSANGYRLYSQDAVRTLAFIKQSAALGLTLAEIREIIAVRDGGVPPCAHVRLVLEDKARDLDRKLRDLIDMRRQIRQSLAAWSRTKLHRAAVCPHIEGEGVAESMHAQPPRRRKD